MTSRIVSSTRAPDDAKNSSGPGVASQPNQSPTRLAPVIDRLSAVSFSGMVRDQIPNLNFIDSKKSKNEETRLNKRASSIGATLRRLFSQSPAPNERSPSQTKSILGPPTQYSPESSGAVRRGRTPPKQTNSPNISSD